MKISAWREFKEQRPIQCGEGFIVANKDDTVIVIVARKGEPVFGILDQLLTEANKPETP